MSDIPDDVIAHYNLKEKQTKYGFIYIEVRKGMYGLSQAGQLAQELPEERLEENGYHQSEFTPGLWLHDWRPIQLYLVVDDFRIKYIGEEHKQHLISAIQKHYECTVDDSGSKYCGRILQWDYQKRKVHVPMPEYVAKALKRFKHPPPNKP